MPIVNFSSLCVFRHVAAQKFTLVRKQLESLRRDSESIRQFGEEVVPACVKNCCKLAPPGLHFYT